MRTSIRNLSKFSFMRSMNTLIGSFRYARYFFYEAAAM